MIYGPVDGVMSTLIYDCRNRLISAGGVTYAYDAENNRISAETVDYIEEYVTDTVSATLSRVLTTTVYEKRGGVAETTGTTITYLYGQGLIREQTGSVSLYHHYNHLGSTMLLTDDAGNVVETYTYGVYGELLSGDASLTSFLYNGRCGVSTDDNGLYYMRQRYYNPEIKRFVNQDILTGSLSNSQSLNQYSYVQGNPISYTDPFGLSPINGLFSGTNKVHTILGLLSCLPGVGGALASVIDAGIYAVVDKDYGMAALCMMDAVAVGIGGFALIAQANKMTNTAKVLANTSRLMSNVSSFGQNAMAGMQTAFEIRDKYNRGESISGMDILSLGMSVVGCAISGRGISSNTKALGNMLNDASFTKGLKSELGQFASSIKTNVIDVANNNYGFANISDEFGKKSGSKATGTYGDLVSSGQKDAHHIIQDAAVRDIPGYSRMDAPAIQLDGPSNVVGTEHYYATITQRRTGGGTYGAERGIAYMSLRKAGLSVDNAKAAVRGADDYFMGQLGLTLDSPTRIPGNRRQ